jgi:hypothetical protein
MHRLLAVTFVLLGPAWSGAEPLTFSAIGCGPYKAEEEPLLERYVALVGADGKSEFLVHLGDIVSGTKKAWPESQYARVAQLLAASKVPVLIVPGDNEWNDLDDPALGWQHWTKHFLHFEKRFAGAPKLGKQTERPENFAWTSKGVLLIGINLVGGRVHDKKEWQTRMKEDADWIQEQMTKHRDQVRAAVVFAQAMPTPDHEPFFRTFAEHCKAFTKPVLYLHADGHVWQLQKAWRAPNLLRVQTDMLGGNPPVLVTVTDDAEVPFVFDRRLKKK